MGFFFSKETHWVALFIGGSRALDSRSLTSYTLSYTQRWAEGERERSERRKKSDKKRMQTKAGRCRQI